MRLLWPLVLLPVLCVLAGAWWAADFASGAHAFPHVGARTFAAAAIGALFGFLTVRGGLGLLRATLWGAIAGAFTGAVLGSLGIVFPYIEHGAAWGALGGAALGALFLRSGLGMLALAIAGLLAGAVAGTALGGAQGAVSWVFFTPGITALVLLAWALACSALAALLAAIVGAMVFAAEFVAVVLLLGIAYAMLRVSEEIDTPVDREPDVDTVAAIMSRENQAAQNHLAGVSVIKAGPVRRLALRLVFWFIGEFGRYLSPAGYLCGIGTIHFARWMVLPGTDKLLFYSNYDGSWESYLEDFIARAHGGLSAIWSNTRDFPRTRSLVIGGASDGERFKRWARRQQRPTLFWYSAYPELTTQRIRTNARICHGLAAARSEADAARWLELMQYRAPATVEAHEVPALVFGGLKPLNHSRCLVLELPGDRRECGRWLGSVRERLQYGEDRPPPQAVVLGFTHTGLQKLGMESALPSFPAAFHQGMAAPGRTTALGDLGADHPSAWLWGGPANPADAVLIVYADSRERLENLCRQLRAEFGAGQKLAYELALAPLPPKDAPGPKEPFGFTDGVSQPILKGSRKWVTQRNPIHVVEPGEMVLGYPDNLGYVAPLPMHGGMDLGTNGSFLVIRQLEQNTEAFREFVSGQAKLLAQDARAPTPSSLAPAKLEDWVAAKMVGRWQDGSSLVRHPARPAIDSKVAQFPDNDFLFGVEDPDGLCCPFGAHIRRANPRESFEPGSQTQIGITNRHRIFRVGRSYGPQARPQGRLDRPGLLFMCVNADIEGQFEFLQQTWILGANFHGLSDELDPAVGYRAERGAGETFTIPTEKGPIRLKGLKDFVTMRGGGYFFMPSRRVIDYLRDCALGREPAQDAPGY
jgi:Dyp-type peroxidase family